MHVTRVAVAVLMLAVFASCAAAVSKPIAHCLVAMIKKREVQYPAAIVQIVLRTIEASHV
jgi:hypothetical protein